MKSGIFGLLFGASLLSASPAFALFNVQVLGGQRSSEFKGDGESTDIKGSELRFAAHLDPIPLVPVAFGLAFSQTDFDDEDVAGGTAKFEGTDIDLEVEAWIPLDIVGLVPYGKISYTIAGEYKNTLDVSGVSSDPTFKYKPSGASLHVGVKYEFLLRLGIMAEVEFGNRKLEFDKAENVGGLNISSEDVDQKSTSFLIGAQAGI